MVAKELKARGWNVDDYDGESWSGLALYDDTPEPDDCPFGDDTDANATRYVLFCGVDDCEHAGQRCPRVMVGDVTWAVMVNGIFAGFGRTIDEEHGDPIATAERIHRCMAEPTGWETKPGTRKRDPRTAPPGPVLGVFTDPKGGKHPVLCLPQGQRWAFGFGAAKARSIVRNLEAVQSFAEMYA
jgi:hypothetical protein